MSPRDPAIAVHAIRPPGFRSINIYRAENLRLKEE
jgi:hypothetical protein